RVFSIAYQVNEVFSSTALGIITIDYKTDGIGKAFSRFADNYKGRIVILAPQDEIIFDSSGTCIEKETPLAMKPAATTDYSDNNGNDVISTEVSSSSGVLTFAVISGKLIQKEATKAQSTIFIIAIVCIIFTILLTHFVMNKFSRRINSVMEGIKNIRSGNFSTRIPIEDEEDEISEIASSFNGMCTDMNEYIRKVYVSEIHQKNAQLNALQAQINPHFLYNTLEAIRMKALVKGAKEAGDMIYLLSNLFRSSIKNKMIISIDEEIKHSKMYIELFNLRFMNKIKLDFIIEDDTRNYAIIKHSIQPLIENYILHGLDMERDDNSLLIKSVKEGNDIYIYIMDNGTGISKERLDSIKVSLHNLNGRSSSSIGLSNVNERIKLLFGDKYGVSIESSEAKGTVVTLRIPSMTIEELEKNVQGSDC
ncbi:MAG: histidine kinase, partial [Clostridiaceae bacterium]|nr:histidine kinase [Clostridiaceae bacterium]